MESQRPTLAYPPFDVMSRQKVQSASWGQHQGQLESPGTPGTLANEPFGTLGTDDWVEGSWAQLAPDGCITQCRTEFDGTELSSEPMPRQTVYSKENPGSNVLSIKGHSQGQNAPGIVLQQSQCAPRQSDAALVNPRLRWTPELHELFVKAVAQLGGANNASAKGVLRVMGVDGLTISHVRRHLQKFRLSRDPPESQEVKTEKKGNQDMLQLLDQNADIQVTEALRLQLETQERLYAQLEVQRQLQLRIEEHGKYHQKIIGDQNMYGGPKTEPTALSKSSSLVIQALPSTAPAAGASETEGLATGHDEGAGEPALKKARTDDQPVEQADQDPVENMSTIAKLSVIVSQTLLAGESKQAASVPSADSERESQGVGLAETEKNLTREVIQVANQRSQEVTPVSLPIQSSLQNGALSVTSSDLQQQVPSTVSEHYLVGPARSALSNWNRRACDNVEQVENSPVGKGAKCKPGSSSMPEQSNVLSTLSQDLTSLGDVKNVKMENYPIEPTRRASDNVRQVENSPVWKGAKCSPGSNSRPDQDPLENMSTIAKLCVIAAQNLLPGKSKQGASVPSADSERKSQGVGLAETEKNLTREVIQVANKITRIKAPAIIRGRSYGALSVTSSDLQQQVPSTVSEHYPVGPARSALSNCKRRACDNVEQVENSPVGKGAKCSPGSSSRPEQSNVSSTLAEDLTSLWDLKKVKMEHYPIEPTRRASDNMEQVENSPVGKGAKCSPGSNSRPEQSDFSETLWEKFPTSCGTQKKVELEHHRTEPARVTSDTGGLVEMSLPCPKGLVDDVTSKSTLSCFTRPALQSRGDLNRVKAENHPDEPVRRAFDKLTQGERSPAAKGAKCAPGTYCAEDLMREVKDRCEAGYFLSSEWLLRLEQNQRESLMLFLSRAGYSETYHTSMTTLFERIDNDGKNPVTGNEPSGMVTKDEICTKDLQVGAPQGGDASLEIAGERLNTDNGLRLDTFYDSKCLQEKSPEVFLTNSTSNISVEEQTPILNSFFLALKSNRQHSYAVSTDWLSGMEDHEKEELETIILEAGYTKIHQESNVTTFERIQGDVGHPATNSCNNPLIGSEKSCVGASDTQKQSASGIGGLLPNEKLKGKVDEQGTTTENVGVANTVKKGQTQAEDSPCRPQILKVTCSSLSEISTMPSTSSSYATNLRHFRKQQFGDSVVTMPRKGGSRTISTTIDKSFPMTTVTFCKETNSCREVCVPLKAIATTTIGCCLRIDHNPNKLRVKFSKISGEVRNEGSREQRCNALALSSLRTNIYACINNEETEDESEELTLNLEDEYNDPPHCRYIDNDLVWLKSSGIDPANCEPGSITLELQGNVRRRCKADLAAQVERAHVLHFQESRPVALQGDIPVALNPNLFLELNVSYQLEVSYIKPCTPVPKEATFVSGRRKSEVIDFDCCLDFTTKKFSVD